jgi:hypothetical protein
MTGFKAWATHHLINLSLWLASAFGCGVDASPAPTVTGDTWTATGLTRFGLQMSKGFGLGL